MAMAALLLFAAGCGDDSGGSPIGVGAQEDSDDGGLTPPPDDDDDGAAGGSGGDDNDSGSSGGDGNDDSGNGGATGEGASTQFCQFISQIDQETDTVGDEFDTLDPSDLSDAYAGIQGYIDQAVTMAPGPIQDDVNYLASAFSGFNEILAEYDYDIFAMLSDPSVEADPRFQEFDSDEFDAADERVNNFCGIENVPSGGSAGSDGDVPDIPIDGEMREIIISTYQSIFGWDEALATCVVDELGLNDPTGAIDPEVFSDPNAQICGQSLTELFSG